MKIHEYYKNKNINPTGFELTTKEQLDEHRRKRYNLYVNKLHIPNIIWKDARVLDCGCASGENSLILAELGANITFIEPVKEFTDELKELFRYWELDNQISDIYNVEIQKYDTNKKYDVVICEALIDTLDNKSEVYKKLFSLVNEDGLLITTTLDPMGSFLEYFKIFLARHVINDVEFLREDYEKIPHSRSFESWIDDTVNNGFVNSSSFYGFNKLMRDIKELKPVYYSSYPNYSPDGYVWYKHTESYEGYTERIKQEYINKKFNFILGMPIIYDENVESIIWDTLKHMDTGDVQQIEENILDIYVHFDGYLKRILREMIFILSDKTEERYKKSRYIRRFWGTPLHYIVFRKMNHEEDK